MADDKKNPLGPVGEQVRANVVRLREARGLTKKQLADRTQELGRAVPPLGVSRIEAGSRRVDADDLVVLADALNVSPLDLLLPPTANDTAFGLTSKHVVKSRIAWQWALGERPAMDWDPGEGVNLAEPGASPAISADVLERDEEYGRRRSEYVGLALPPELRRTSNHPLVNLAQQLEQLAWDIVSAPGDKTERTRWVRNAQRRIQSLQLNLDELTEVLENGDGGEALVRMGLATRTILGADGQPSSE